MMNLTEHLIDLLLRSAERLKRLPEVKIHEILEQSVVHANCTGEQFIREHVQLDRFIIEENLRENLRGDVLVRLRVQHTNIVPLDDQLVNLLQAEVPAASAVIIASILVLSDFQWSRFVAVVFRHGVLFSKEQPAVDVWNFSIFGGPASMSKLLMQSQKTIMQKQKRARRLTATITRDALAVRIDKQSGQLVIYPVEDFRKVVEINMIAPIYWAIELVAAVAKDRALPRSQTLAAGGNRGCHLLYGNQRRREGPKQRSAEQRRVWIGQVRESRFLAT